MIEALTASGPVAEHAEQLHLGWVLEGRAVQDVLLSPPRDQRLRPDAPAGEYGTTIRFHDPRIDVWRASWAAPVGARVYTLLARATGEGIVVEGLGPDGGGVPGSPTNGCGCGGGSAHDQPVSAVDGA